MSSPALWMMGTETFGKRPGLLQRWCLAASLVVAMAPLGAEIRDVGSAARGQTLYISGVHSDGRPLAGTNANTGLPLPSAFVACVHCHGYEGRGGTEAGTVVSDIRWDILSKPYDYRRPDGRRRAPYDAAGFRTALTQGLDPSGHALDSAMPRFALDAGAADDLWAYLRQLSNAGDQGVSDQTIRIGVVVTASAMNRETAVLDRQLLTCWFAAVNARGGMFRRRIALVDANPESGQFVDPPLAALVISNGVSDAEDVSVTPGLPMISAAADLAGTEHRYRFAVNPGAVGRARVLARYARDRDTTGTPALALVYPHDAVAPDLVASVEAGLKPLASVTAIGISARDASAAVARMREAELTQVLVLGGGVAMEAFVASVRSNDWDPLLLWIERPEQALGGLRALTVEPALGRDVSPDAGTAYAQCVDVSATRVSDRTRQLALLAAAQLLVTGLEQAGRDISRERLVETLQSLRAFQSGFAPPGSLGGERHVAASGLYVLPIASSQMAAEPVWVLIE